VPVKNNKLHGTVSLLARTVQPIVQFFAENCRVLFALQSEIGPIIIVDDDESGPEIRDTLYTCTCSTHVSGLFSSSLESP
jgi:hypothetical protein